MISLLFQLVGGSFLAAHGLNNFYLGLTFMLMGSGTMVTSINMIVGQSFEAKDKRRERAFFWSYSGMNIGFLVGYAVAGFSQMHSNFSLLFCMAAAVNILCIAIVFFAGKSFKDKDTAFSQATSKQRKVRFSIGISVLFAMCPTVYFLLKHAAFGGYLILTIGALMLVFLAVYTLRLPSEKRKKMLCFIVLLVAAQSFWIIYQMAPMGLMLFAKSEVNLHLFGFAVAPAWISTINSLTIVVGAPLLGYIFNKVRKKYSAKINEPLQFVMGLFCCGTGLLLLKLGIVSTSTAVLIPFAWLFVYSFFQAVAELLISPITYSMVGSLTPKKMQSTMMGIALLNVGVSAILASHISNIALSASKHGSKLVSHDAMRTQFGGTIYHLGLTLFVFAGVLFVLLPWLNRLMGNSKNNSESKVSEFNVTESN